MALNILVMLYLVGRYNNWSLSMTKKVFLSHGYPDHWYKKT